MRLFEEISPYRDFNEVVKYTTPEKMLIYALLFRTYTDLTSENEAVSSLEVARARVWVLSKEYFPFSFLWCCAVLDCANIGNKLREIGRKNEQIKS